MLHHFVAVSFFGWVGGGGGLAAWVSFGRDFFCTNNIDRYQMLQHFAIIDYNATVTKISHMLVIGDALSPLKLSKKKAKL